ncbi:hypothetical protein [Nocardia nepalensis]|uniref:hypothetical protein n=1 Tax=Nocardia nepalensis TaxID=3375448 RepID=UPI003B67826A
MTDFSATWTSPAPEFHSFNKIKEVPTARPLAQMLRSPSRPDELMRRVVLPRAFADGGQVEGGPRTGDDGVISRSHVGRLAPFLQWSSVAQLGGQMLGKALVPQVFAEGGEVDEHGPVDGDDGFLTRPRTGSLFPFLQWHNWFQIFDSTRRQVGQAGVSGAAEALAGAVAGPAGAAVGAAVSAVGNLVQQFSASPKPPTYKALPQVVPLNGSGIGPSGGPQIDRTMTVNVLGSRGIPRDPGMAQRLNQQAATYLSHLR